MFRNLQILVSTLVLGVLTVALFGCGQQGSLYLPTEPAAAKRATLPETLLRSGSSAGDQTPTPTPVKPTAATTTPTSK